MLYSGQTALGPKMYIGHPALGTKMYPGLHAPGTRGRAEYDLETLVSCYAYVGLTTYGPFDD